MSTTATTHQTKWWSGGKSPFNIEYGKLMMWYFLMSDAFTFGAFLISYGSIRFSQNFWPDPNVVFNAFPGFGHKNLPLAFLGCQAWEWHHLITGEHVVLADGKLEMVGQTMGGNPWGHLVDPAVAQ